CCIAILLAGPARLRAQQEDTLKLSLTAAEQRFLDSNFTLLASKYNIDIAKAEVITAGLYTNPELSYENILYNPENRKIYDVGYNGNNQVELSKVFRLAGKRNKSIRLAESGVKLSEYDFFDLIRTLNFELRDNFFRIYFYRHSFDLYEFQLNSLKQILGAFREQLNKGNIASKDVLRVQSLIINLSAEQTNLLNEINEATTEIKTLLRIDASTPFLPEWDHNEVRANPLANVTYMELLDSARVNRYDLKQAKEQIQYQQLNLQLQKAMAVPDLTVAATYDKQGNFTRNYNGLLLSMPLPFFNRNQGNIKQAKSQVEQTRVLYRQTEDQLNQQVKQQYELALNTEKLYDGIDTAFDSNYNKLIGEVRSNFLRRNITILEFIDFYDSYKETITQLNEIRYRRFLALEAINYTVGKNIIQF
ncbi:MAG: TolC family protein, partial [Flavitalea sp.]